MQIEQLNKDKKNLEERLKVLSKKNDHTERAFRRYELQYLEKDAEKQKEEDIKNYESLKQLKISKAKKEHEESLALRERLQRIIPDFEPFKKMIDEKHSSKLAELRKEAQAAFEQAKRERIERVKHQRIEELMERREYERKEAEEAEIKRKRQEEMDKFKEELRLQKEKDSESLRRRQEMANQATKPAAPEPAPAPAQEKPSAPLTFAEKMRLKRLGKLN